MTLADRESPNLMPDASSSPVGSQHTHRARGTQPVSSTRGVRAPQRRMYRWFIARPSFGPVGPCSGNSAPRRCRRCTTRAHRSRAPSGPRDLLGSRGRLVCGLAAKPATARVGFRRSGSCPKSICRLARDHPHRAREPGPVCITLCVRVLFGVLFRRRG